MIEVKGLTKTYRDRTAISGVTFSVKRGEVLGFLGPNGAGKSTTMKILSGLIQASSGTAVIEGCNVKTQALAAKANIGYLPETPPVYASMEVEDYLFFAAALHRVPRLQRQAQVVSAMERCGLLDVRERLIGNLSKGYRQRVGLAQAITHNPLVLILDEPTVGLDPRQIIEIRHLIRSFAGKHTVILSTHILSEVKATCDRVVVIDRGKLIAEDTLAGLVARMDSRQRIELVLRRSAAAILGRLREIAGVIQVQESAAAVAGEFSVAIDCERGTDVRAEVAEICVGAGLGLLQLRQEEMSLEDAFVKLISSDKEIAAMEPQEARA